MLSEKRYANDYVKGCRAQFMAVLDAYDGVSAPDDFEQGFLAHMILGLDHYFLHRMRGAEGKDGNPLNEVRMLCNAIKHHEKVMTADNTIKYDASRAVLGTEVGAPIRFDAGSVRRLAEGFFSEIEARYS